LICNKYYKKWKEIALKTLDRKAVERALFWLEMQNAFTALHFIEQLRNDRESKIKIIKAKAILSKKLADYAKEILKDLNF
jgi:flavin-dependent dehydrogenase